MIYYLITIVFIVSIAITSGSIVISSHLRITYKSEFFSTLLFFLIFYFTFGFYTIWGQLILISFISPHVPSDLLPKITEIMVLLGSPFLIFASLMFIKFAKEISGYRIRSMFIIIYLAINVLIIAAIGFISFKNQEIQILTFIRYYNALLSFFFTVSGIFALLLKANTKSKFQFRDRANLCAGLFLLMIFQNILLTTYNNNLFLILIFILIYFIYGSYIPLYIKYWANLANIMFEKKVDLSFKHFCIKYSISPRETEIINEICNGLSNQQIADKLFISLQTVKDHTHRIYGKTDCLSRAQLIKLVNECS